MRRITFLLVLVAAGWSAVCAAGPSTNSAAAGRVLMIENSSMPMATGKATLIIGPLQRTNGIYTGDYKVKVLPYFFKNEKGRLAMVVSDAALAEAGQGKTVAITGTAITTKTGKSRPIEATVTPADSNHGTVKLNFMAGSRKMIFTTAYHFVEPGTTVVPATTTRTNLATVRPHSRPEAVASAH